MQKVLNDYGIYSTREKRPHGCWRVESAGSLVEVAQRRCWGRGQRGAAATERRQAEMDGAWHDNTSS